MSGGAIDPSSTRAANVVGLGLIGASAALALRELGYAVSGTDRDDEVENEALAIGIVERIGVDPAAQVTFVATPVDQVAGIVADALAGTGGVVIDTGSVKAEIAAAVSDPRFVPTHPMAGSEQSGLEGARSDLFRGATWVITPTDETSDDSFAFAHELVTAFGADPVTLAPAAHDRMVAAVSHVPHLAAAALMNVADARSSEHLAMLRLAAGGFRDMTRIAAGSPEIWPSICAQNSDAISAALQEVIDALASLRRAVDERDDDTIRRVLTDARRARVNLPGASALPESMSEVRVRIKDQRGEIAALATLAAELDINIYDFEIAHSTEGPTGVVVLLIDSAVSERFRGGLLAKGYRPSIRELT